MKPGSSMIFFAAELTMIRSGITTCRHSPDGGTLAARPSRPRRLVACASVPGGEHAELVALRVGHDDPGRRAGILPDVDTRGAEGLEAADFGLLVPVWRRGQVDVHPVLHRLAFGKAFMF